MRMVIEDRTRMSWYAVNESMNIRKSLELDAQSLSEWICVYILYSYMQSHVTSNQGFVIVRVRGQARGHVPTPEWLYLPFCIRVSVTDGLRMECVFLWHVLTKRKYIAPAIFVFPRCYCLAPDLNHSESSLIFQIQQVRIVTQLLINPIRPECYQR